MEAERREARSSKRTPLADLTNRKLPSHGSTKPPIPKPYNSISKSNKAIINSSKSDSSIGSSNNNVQHPNRVPLPHPFTPPPKPPPLSSPTNPDNDDGDEPLVVYSRRQSAKKTKSKRDVGAVTFSHTSLEETRDRDERVSMSFSCSLVEKTKDNGKAVTFPFSCPPVENAKDKEKNISVPFACLSSVKTKDKGKAVDVGSSFPSLAKTKDKGKTVAIPLNYHTVEKNKGRGISLAYSCPPLPRTRKNRNEFNEAGDILQSKSHTDAHQYKKKRRCSPRNEDIRNYALPQDFIEQQRAYFKEVDEFELPEEEVSY